jgi:MFS family permease
MLSMIIAAIAGGFFNSKIGYYTPLAIAGSCVMSVGLGLLTTLGVNANAGQWIGYQILYGIGLGCCFQIPSIAVQTALPKKEVPTGIALVLLGTSLGGAVFVAVGENVLSNQLMQRFSGIPGFDPSFVTSGGATSLLSKLPASSRPAGISAYNEALRSIFRVGLIPSCLSILGVASLEWLSVKKPQPKAGEEEST